LIELVADLSEQIQTLVLNWTIALPATEPIFTLY